MDEQESDLEILPLIYTPEEIQINELEDGMSEVKFVLTPQLPRYYSFISTTLVLKVPPSYPTDPPSITLEQSVGINQDREKILIQYLEQEMAPFVGEQVLTSICESARNWVQSNNLPDGVCHVCLDNLVDSVECNENDHVVQSKQNCTGSTSAQPTNGGATGRGGRPLVAWLPCKHMYHWECFKEYYQQEQVRYQQKSQSIAQHGASVIHLVQDKPPPTNSNGQYQIKCMVCRQAIPFEDMDRYLKVFKTLA